MNRPVLPKHVVAVLKHTKDPLKALEIFNSVKKEDRYEHNFLTYKCIIDKLGAHGQFEAMEGVISEMRRSFDNGSMEGVYVSAMRNYGKEGKVQEAVDVFERMDIYDCERSVLSYNAIMNVLVEYGHFDQAQKVYIRMNGGRIVPDSYTFTIRIKSFCRSGKFQAALRLLRIMPEVNEVAYCTVIGGYYEANLQIEGCELFSEMTVLGLVPDVTTFNKLISVLCKKGDVRESERLFSKVLKRGVTPNLFTFNIFLQGFRKSGLLDQASKMLDLLLKEGSAPDIVTYNTLISGLCKHSKVAEAESYMRKMINRGLEPDLFTYNTLIDGYCKLGVVKKADEILKLAICKGFRPDEFTYCAMIYGLCGEGDITRAMNMLREAAKNGITHSIMLYNTIIKGLSKKGLILEAQQMMNEMEEKGCIPDIWTYNMVINGLCKMGHLSDASNLVTGAMNRGLVPDIFTFNTLIDGYCKLLQMNNALKVVDVMWEHGVTPDLVTYNSVLNGFCKTKASDDVMETFKAMLKKGYVPNIITYNILIESLCRARKLEGALGFLQEMESRGLSPDALTYGALLNGYCETGDIDGAFEIFRRAEKQRNFSHTTSTYNIMLKACSISLNTKMAVDLFHEMSRNGCIPNEYSYHCMIRVFCNTGDVDSAYRYLINKVKKGLRPSLRTFGRVLNCLCQYHKIREAVVIIHIMVKKDRVPRCVNRIFEADKREAQAPKLVVEELMKKVYINQNAYDLLFEGIRDKSLLRKKRSQR